MDADLDVGPELVDHSPDRALQAGANQRWVQLFHDRPEVVAVYLMEEVLSVGQPRGNVAVAVFNSRDSRAILSQAAATSRRFWMRP